MLNRPKLLSALGEKIDQLFPDYRHEHDIARQIWHQICQDPLFVTKARAVVAPWPVPQWVGALDKTYSVSPWNGNYRALSVDGSQIYPDRHQHASCFLINIGSVDICYKKDQKSMVLFDSQPFVFSSKEFQKEGEFSRDFVNAQRQYLEMLAGLQRASEAPCDTGVQTLFFDGSLIFWHLESKTHDLLEQFLPKYLAILQDLYEKKIMTVGYISLPRSRELVNLIRLELCDFNINNQEPCKLVDGVLDAAVVGFYVEPCQRTTVFENRSSIAASYPAHSAPYFFYLNVGEEIARVEIPAWIAWDQNLTDSVASIVLDQALKGRGYPVVLAEAHEQAVVKGPDREFFYHLLDNIGIKNKQRVTSCSKKSMHKRIMGV